MFDFFKIGRSKPQRGNGATDDSFPPSSVPPTTQQHTATHRELIRVVLRDTLRMSGIPSDWITCEILKLPRNANENGLLIQLVIQHWNEDLLRYAIVIQQQLLSGLAHFDPASDHSKHLVSWRFSPHCTCPYTSMPEPKFWTTAPAANVKPKFDLPPSRHDEDDNENTGFSPTVPNEFR